MNKIVIITGLTATGKSGLAVEVAKQFNGEIISADSVQIYKGLDIGSAKVDKQTMSEIFHYNIDIKEFNETYNVGQFLIDTKKAISEIISKGKIPIIVGGTGLYIKALIEGYSLGETCADDNLRKHYENIAKQEGNIAVWEELNKLNPEKAKTVHFNNLKRVIRYIEIEINGQHDVKAESILKDLQVCAVGVVEDRDSIYNKINSRVDIMIESGLENEVKGLINKGATKDMQSMTAIGYKEWFDYFEGKLNLNETIDLIKQHSRNYCKRQLTFLKSINNLELLTLNQAREKIKEFLK
ncbi:MAG: tRNA (adenosine(37)-N6)-dimethylallyltransferase MiaA [Candidatus Onthoplasma sp.]